MSAKKRFYKEVTTSADNDGHLVHLDGRTLRSPAGAILALPTALMAGAVAAEWDAQGDEIEPGAMPIFSLAVTVIDRVSTQRETLIDEMATYGANDLMCYREQDDDLSGRQNAEWTPWLDWARDELDAPLLVTGGIMPITQPDQSVAALRGAVAAHDDWELGMLHRVVALGGSLVLGLAFVRGKIDAKALFKLAFLDELWQVEQWGSDWEAEDRRDALIADFTEAETFLALKRDNTSTDAKA